MTRRNRMTFFKGFLITALSVCLSNLYAQQHPYPPDSAKWVADSLGNQRAVVRVFQAQQTVTIRIDWRNRQVGPEQMLYVVDSATQTLLTNTTAFQMGPERGTVRFSPVSGPGIYYVYYLPYHLGGRSRNYPDAVYKTQPISSGSPKPDSERVAQVLRLESVDAFNDPFPMEFIATADEVEKLKKQMGERPYFLFPERRGYPVKMRKYLPLRWINTPMEPEFLDTASRGEHFTFQLGVWAFQDDLKNVRVRFSDLTGPEGSRVSGDSLICFNTQGIDYTGKFMQKMVDVPSGEVQALWIGWHVPQAISPGLYQGQATVSVAGLADQHLPIRIEIDSTVSPQGGMDKPWLQTRLHWLNSTLAQNNTVVDPYVPIEVSNRTLSILGRKLTLNDQGLPVQIQSYFTPEMTEIGAEAKDLLADPFSFVFTQEDGSPIVLKAGQLEFLSKQPGTVTWQALNTAPQLDMNVRGSLEFDGYVNYEIQVVAKQPTALRDIALQIPLEAHAARYLMGLGKKGGYLKEAIDWKWDVKTKNQDGMWIGDVNAGLQLTLKDQHYQRPLNTNFYLQKPLVLPQSWGNRDKGGIRIQPQGAQVQVTGFSGERELQVGDTLYYNFTLLITPFHPLQTDAQWEQRYYHAYNPIDSVLARGSNIINIHHANEINPYINYPFIATREMKSYIDSAHRAGLKVKIYNTVREVSNRVYELYPMRSLGHEVFSAGPGKGYSWLQEHVHDDYIAAWFVPRFKDAAIINSGMSRWHNYYVEGMNWLVQHMGIDGIYLDDVAFDRVTMKRIKRVLTQRGKPGLIDLHSANQYNERDGFNNSANLYMEHFPYINRLWFGEYFDYESGTPDFYMTEISGIPFGLMGEMLQDGGNPYRGMLYGMTNRMPYQAKRPDQIWKAWDDFGIQGSRMIGYWVEDSPVKTSNEHVLATLYKKKDKVLISLASWAPEDTQVTLNIDWKALDLDPKKVCIIAPGIPDFQSHRVFDINEPIPVEKNKGWLLIIE